jgi:hypothetical protein
MLIKKDVHSEVDTSNLLAQRGPDEAAERPQYFSKVSSMNFGYSSILTNLRSTERSKNRNHRNKFEFFPEPFPNE